MKAQMTGEKSSWRFTGLMPILPATGEHYPFPSSLSLKTQPNHRSNHSTSLNFMLQSSKVKDDKGERFYEKLAEQVRASHT